MTLFLSQELYLILNFKMVKNMVRIVIDCFGGDNSPIANIEGALEAL